MIPKEEALVCMLPS